MFADGAAAVDHFAVPDAAAFSPDGRLLAVAISRVALKVYEMDPNCESEMYKCHRQNFLTNVKRIDWCPIAGFVVGVCGVGSVSNGTHTSRTSYSFKTQP